MAQCDITKGDCVAYTRGSYYCRTKVNCYRKPTVVKIMRKLTRLGKSRNTNVTVNTLVTVSSETLRNVKMDAYLDLKSHIVKSVSKMIVKILSKIIAGLLKITF
ncbi:uncharacterized protein LOC118761882 isoform X2 [Octopus sinensis]|uniref:Uncharacterized protein LOC118761882 isoform X2 n=1 Tax=Octopus sinensis TaxID=2607531 RepID=A0A7E6EMB4_9MOLL|nr:uncharacterized protein LOC118761882 isoform X2 [Octopus sinensis]